MNHTSENPFRTAVQALSEPYTALARVAVVLIWPLRAAVKAIREKRTAAALNALDSRTLRDIGIDRHQVGLVAQMSVEFPAVDPRVVLDRRIDRR
jgi:uncharacterized protein YjiS (DUF1127 family)